MKRKRQANPFVLAAAVIAATQLSATAAAIAADQPDADVPALMQETDRPAPVDYGPGPGVPKKKATDAASLSALAATGAVPEAGAATQTKGAFGPWVNWPIIPIHAVLLPDGRVMSYGSTETGKQGGALVYDVWTPRLGTGTNSHNTLPNGTRTDIFCSGQSIMAENGQVLITGGDRTINGQRNYSIPDTTIFNPGNDSLRKANPMAYARWYPSIVTTPGGEMVILGGREDFIPKPGDNDIIYPARVPEVYQRNGTYRTLSNASNDIAYGSVGWYYPRGFQAPNGKVFILVRTGKMFFLDPAGQGTLTQVGQTTLAGGAELPTLMYASGRILSLRLNGKVVLVNLNGAQPAVSQTQDIDQLRRWSNTTLLADGRVLVNGGSVVGNKLVGVAYDTQIWNPATGRWTQGADAAKPRLYHSTSLLLPDGSVLTGGGGAPGPVKNLNAEIYYPSYLYRQDGSGQPADRPTIATAPNLIAPGQAFGVTMGSAGAVSRVTFLRMGTVTHSFNAEQRFFDLPFTQNGQQLSVTAPGDINIALPGYYLLFAFDQAGVPSQAKIIRLRA